MVAEVGGVHCGREDGEDAAHILLDGLVDVGVVTMSSLLC